MERIYENEQELQGRQGEERELGCREERIGQRPSACHRVLEELEQDARVLYGEIERLEAHIRKLKADIEKAERACLGNFPPQPPVPPCRPCGQCGPCHRCGCHCRG